MRLIKISAPEGQGERIIQLAFSSGIEEPNTDRIEAIMRARKNTIECVRVGMQEY